jgi:hypothetical protein
MTVMTPTTIPSTVSEERLCSRIARSAKATFSLVPRILIARHSPQRLDRRKVAAR